MVNISNTFFGFTEPMQPMKKARTENTLDKLYRYSDGVMTCKQHIYNLLKKNAHGEIDPAYSYYSTKTHEETKPKTDYQIHFTIVDDGEEIAVYNSVTKTEYDFFMYLSSNGLFDDEKAQQYINHEQNKIQEQERLQAEQLANEKAEQKRIEQEQEQFNQWIETEITNYSNDNKLNIAKQIFLDTVNTYADHQLKKLLILIDNIDKAVCKNELKEWLSYYNTASKKVFYHITGIKLPQTDKDTCVLLDSITHADYQGTIEYKAVQKTTQATEKPLDTFYILDNTQQFKAVQGEAISKYGLDLFMHKQDDNFKYSDVRTGVLMAYDKTRTEADCYKNNIRILKL